MTFSPRYWLRRFGESELYRLLAPVLLVGCILTASAASLGTYLVYRTQADESSKRVAAVSQIQECFDSYASASADTSKLVRVAAARVSAAQTTRDQALQAVFDDIAKGKDGAASFAALLDANRALVRASNRLAEVRADNPVPDPPSSFCDVQP